LDSARSDVVADLSDIPVVAFEDFVRHVLPAPIDDNDIAIILQYCQKDNAIIENQRWSLFLVDPAEMSSSVFGKECTVFTRLGSLWQSIMKVAKGRVPGKEEISYIITKNASLKKISERCITTLPDGSLVLNETTAVSPPTSKQHSQPPIRWDDITVPHEYKKNDSPKDCIDVSAILMSLPRVCKLITLIPETVHL
jgi:hypothetical protein